MSTAAPSVSWMRYTFPDGVVRLCQPLPEALVKAWKLRAESVSEPMPPTQESSPSEFALMTPAQAWDMLEARNNPKDWAGAAIAWATRQERSWAEKAALKAAAELEPEGLKDLALTFAEAGMWGTKSALALSQQLLERGGAEMARAVWQKACLQACASGQPPHLSWLKEMERLGGSSPADRRTWLFELLNYPASAYAPSSVWELALRATQEALKQGESLETRWLIRAFPLAGEARAVARAWVGLLLKYQVLARWAEQGEPEEAKAWVERALTQVSDGAVLGEALEALARPLQRVREPLHLSVTGLEGPELSLTLVKKALQLGLPLAAIPPDVRVNWDSLEPDLHEVLGHPVLGPLLRQAWGERCLSTWPQVPHEPPMAYRLSLAWLFELLAQAESGQLLAQERLVSALQLSDSPLRLHFPELREAFDAFFQPQTPQAPLRSDTLETWPLIDSKVLWRAGASLWGESSAAEETSSLSTQLQALARALTHAEPIELPACDLHWPYLLVWPRALASLASMPQRQVRERQQALEALSQVWRLVSNQRLTSLSFQSVELYQVEAAEPFEHALLKRQGRGGLVYQQQRERLVELWQPGLGSSKAHWLLRFSPELRPAPLEDAAGLRVYPLALSGESWVERLREASHVYPGPMPWSLKAQEALRLVTGLAPEEAQRVLLGLWQKHELPPSEWLKASKLNAAVLLKGAETLPELSGEALWALLHEGAPEDPAILVDPERQSLRANVLGQAYVRRFGCQEALPRELLELLQREFGPSYPLTSLIRVLLKPQSLSLEPLTLEQGAQELFSPRETALSQRGMSQLLELALWVYAHRPYDCPLRQKVPAFLSHLTQVLRLPGRLWPLGQRPETSADRAREGVSQLSSVQATWSAEGAWVDLIHAGKVWRAYRGEGVDGAVLAEQAKRFAPWQHTDGLARWELVQWVLQTAEGLVSHDAKAPTQGHPADPRVTAPEVVTRVMAEHGLSEDGAVLWLQLRAFANPSKTWLCATNAWSPKRYSQAEQALITRQLASKSRVRGSRRELWLPGPLTLVHGDAETPFEACKLQWLPNAWKLGFRRTLAMTTLTELFEGAAKRMEGE